MRGLWLASCTTFMLVSISQLAYSGELAGKLERVDSNSLTILEANNNRFVVGIDGGSRREVAQFLGKTVTIDYCDENGAYKVLRVKAAK
jgi:hypothetical protein